MVHRKFDYILFRNNITELENINDRGKYNKKYYSIKEWLEWSLKNNNINSTVYKKAMNELTKVQFKGQIQSSYNDKLRADGSLFLSFFEYKYISILLIFLLFIFNIYIYRNYTILNKELQMRETEGRVLPFKGSIKEIDGNPLDTKRDVVFRIYNNLSAGDVLYEGRCVGERGLQPHFDGTFTILVGSDCGMDPIPESIFIENSTLYLGISIGSEAELQPRYQIFTTTYSKDTSKLQGFQLGTSVSSIPYIDDTGTVTLDSDSPILKSTNGIFTIEGKSISIKSQDSEKGDVIIQPGSESSVIIPFGRFSIGNYNPNSLFDLVGTQLFTTTASISNLANADDESTSALRLSLGTEMTGIKTNFIEFFAGATSESSGTKVGDIRLNNEGVVYETSGADFAEYFILNYDEVVAPGTILSLSSKGIHPSVPNQKIVGVASTTAGFIGNRKMNQGNSALIALVGQVDVLVSTLNGELDIGDRIGSTMIPGYGSEVNSNQNAVGYTLKSSGGNLSNDVCPKSYKNRRDPSGKKIRCGLLKIVLDLD